MATILQLRRGTTTQHNTFTGAVGEVTVDTTKDTVVVHDGTTAGGKPLATEAYVTSAIQTKDNSDEITEGSTNLYFTTTRARDAVSVTDSGGDGSLAYNNSTGVFTFTGPSAADVRAHFSASTGISITNGAISSTITQYTDALARGAVSVTDSGGDGSLAYNSTTGVITYTGPSAANVRAHFSASTGITITDGAIATTITQYTDALARGAISVTDSGGDGSLSYNNTNGVITYTGPSATDVRAHFSAGTGVTITNGQVAIGQAVGTGSNVTFNDLTVSGNLTVSGTTTTVNTETINLADNIITLNSNEAGTPSQNAGIEVERGSSTNVAFQWNETTDVWEYTVDGTNYIPVVGTTATQTLSNKTISGSSNTLSNIANSSLTNSKVTIGSTDVSLGGTVTTFAGLSSVTSTSFVGALTGNASTVTNGVYTTDTGSVTNTMLAGSIANSKLTNSSITINGTAVSLGGSVSNLALTTGKLSQFAATTSSELAGVISDETGTGALVFANTPTLVTPNIGAATGTSLTTTGGGLLARAAATQDGIEIRGRAGGTGNWEAILTPTTLSADRTFTFPDVSGTVVTTGDTGSVTNAMLAGSIANAKLTNSSITLAGTAVSLGGSFTATNMLDAIKTVDGAGSGLDADLLDGNSSAHYRINVYNAAGTLLN
jgi:methylphosphotriester-DNA--protein-cysteine methyltransferase